MFKVSNWAKKPQIIKYQTMCGAALLLASMAILAVALLFEHVGGFMPCDLCLKERVAYYIGIFYFLLLTVVAYQQYSIPLTRVLFLLGAVLMFANSALSIYHAGAEYQFWPGPDSCAAATSVMSQSVNDLWAGIQATRPPSCTTAAGYFLGLSFAGWNVVASGILGLVCVFGALYGRRRTK